MEGTILFIALLFKLLNCCSSSYVSVAENLIYSHCSRCLLSTPLQLVVLFFLLILFRILLRGQHVSGGYLYAYSHH